MFQMFECENTLLETDCRRVHANLIVQKQQQARQVKYKLVATAPAIANANANVKAQVRARAQAQAEAAAMGKVGDSRQHRVSEDAATTPLKIPKTACSQDFFRVRKMMFT